VQENEAALFFPFSSLSSNAESALSKWRRETPLKTLIGGEKQK
jgi:hypothetical protein